MVGVEVESLIFKSGKKRGERSRAEKQTTTTLLDPYAAPYHTNGCFEILSMIHSIELAM